MYIVRKSKKYLNKKNSESWKNFILKYFSKNIVNLINDSQNSKEKKWIFSKNKWNLGYIMNLFVTVIGLF